MVCKGCGERLYGPRRDYCKACKGQLAASLPSGPEEASMPDEQAIQTPEAPRQEYAPLPEGFRYLYNRTDERFEGMFDGRIYELQPHEVKAFQCHVAEHLRAHSIIPGTLRRDPKQNRALIAERSVALGPGWTVLRYNKTEGADQFGNSTYSPEYVEAKAEADFGVPTTTKPGMELFDRASIANYVDKPGLEGRPTHVEYIRVG